jgi:hypothetical protein
VLPSGLRSLPKRSSDSLPQNSGYLKKIGTSLVSRVVRMPGEDSERAVDLLGQYDASKLMR